MQTFDGASREEVKEEVPPTRGVEEVKEEVPPTRGVEEVEEEVPPTRGVEEVSEEVTKVQKVQQHQVEEGKGKTNVTLEPREPDGPAAKKAKKAKLQAGGVSGEGNELRQATFFQSPTILPMPCPSQTVICLCHSPSRRLSRPGGVTPPNRRGAKEASPCKKPRLTAQAQEDQEVKAWEGAVDEFVELAGTYHLVAGDGSCWMWSMLCAIGVLQHGNEINFREKNKRAKKVCSSLSDVSGSG